MLLILCVGSKTEAMELQASPTNNQTDTIARQTPISASKPDVPPLLYGTAAMDSKPDTSATETAALELRSTTTVSKPDAR